MLLPVAVGSHPSYMKMLCDELSGAEARTMHESMLAGGISPEVACVYQVPYVFIEM